MTKSHTFKRNNGIHASKANHKHVVKFIAYTLRALFTLGFAYAAKLLLLGLSILACDCMQKYQGSTALQESNNKMDM